MIDQTRTPLTSSPIVLPAGNATSLQLDRSMSNFEFDAEADRMSERLASAEAMFQELSDKTAQSVQLNNAMSVSLDRSRDDWSIGLTSYSSDGSRFTPWRNCGMEVRARIAAALPQLLHLVVSKSEERRGLIEAAHASLDAFMHRMRAMHGPATSDRNAA